MNNEQIYEKLMKLTNKLWVYKSHGINIREHVDYDEFLILLGMVQAVRLNGYSVPEIEMCFQLANMKESDVSELCKCN
jgi:hypothetical protein